MLRFLVWAAVVGALITQINGCGKSDNGPTGPEDPRPGTPQPNPDGVLLEGEGEALEAFEPLPPSPADAGAIEDGLLKTRLCAMIASSATVADVNAALNEHGARIVSMQPESPFVTLKIPEAIDRVDAEATAQALMSNSAFLYVTTSYAVRSEPGSWELPEVEKADAPAHLISSRVLESWNLAERVVATNDEITVLVPDEYATLVSHGEIDAQSMVGNGAATPLPGPELYPGNNGFVVSGIIGANVDSTEPTGIHPMPEEYLDIRSLPIGGLGWNDLFWLLAWELAGAGDRFVLNTGLGYNDPNFVVESKFDRAMHVIAWRVAAATHYDKFVHVTSAGTTDADWHYNSPFVAAANFADVREMFEEAELSEQENAALEAAWADLQAAMPLATELAPNVITVGATNSQGSLLANSGPGDARAIGVDVLGPCVAQDPAAGSGGFCDGALARYSGTGVAAAQISGLAAYMLSLGDSSPARVRASILASQGLSETGFVDAYDAVLHLDDSGSMPLREALLDIAGFESTEPDGSFDQYDLERFSVLIANGGPVKAPTDVYPTAFRVDYNGDGEVGSYAARRFDLNADGQYSTLNQSIAGEAMAFDESALTDEQINCYYAYSNLYSGDTSLIAQYVLASHSGLFVELEGVPERVDGGQQFDVTVRAGYILEGGSMQYVEGIEVDFELDGARAEPNGGVTDATGSFQATLTETNDYNEMVVGVWAETDDDEVYVERRSLRKNFIEFLERESSAITSVQAVYNQDVGIPGVRFLQEFEHLSEETTAPLQENITSSANGTGAGINVSASGHLDALVRVEVDSDNQFFATYVDASADATLTLSNPNFEILSYQAGAVGYVEADLEFRVWGEPATFTMHGNVSGTYYDIELSGPDGDLFECDPEDAPCFTISTGGELEPGYYDLSVYLDERVQYHWYRDCDGCSTQGTKETEGSLELDFEVQHDN